MKPSELPPTLSLPELVTMTGLTRHYILRAVEQGGFPAPLPGGTSRKRWATAEVSRYIGMENYDLPQPQSQEPLVAQVDAAIALLTNIKESMRGAI